MSKFTITHSCGHEQVHQLYGKSSERDSKAEWLGNHLCSECYSAELAKNRDLQNQSAAAANAASGLPALVGSEKQIAWAESIRRPICKQFAEVAAELVAEFQEKHFGAEAIEELGDAIALVNSEITENKSARFWIDNRDNLRVGLLWRECLNRGLIPLLQAELKVREAAKVEAEQAAQKAAADRGRLALDLANQLTIDQVRVYAEGRITAKILDHTFELGAAYQPERGFDLPTFDGAPIRDHLDSKRIAARLQLLKKEKRVAEATAALAVCGSEITAVNKSKSGKETLIEVTLASGHKLSGVSRQAGFELDEIDGRLIPEAFLAQVAPIAAAARKFAKKAVARG